MAKKEVATIYEDDPSSGNARIKGAQAADTQLLPRDTHVTTGVFTSEVADGASAVAFTLDTENALSNATAELLAIRNNGTDSLTLDAADDCLRTGYLNLKADATTFTATPPEEGMLVIDTNYTWNYLFGVSHAAVKVKSVNTIVTDLSILGSGFLFWNVSEFVNDDVNGTTRGMGPNYTLASRPTYKCTASGGNTCTLTVASSVLLPSRDVFLDPLLTTDGAGTADVDYGYWAGVDVVGRMDANTTMEQRICFRDFGLSTDNGTCDSSISFWDSNTSTADQRISFLSGVASNATLPTGDYNMYQGDTDPKPNRWGSGHQHAITETSSTSITADADDEYFVCTSNSAITLTLPDSTTAGINRGQTYKIRASGSGTVTLSASGSDSITGGTTITGGNTGEIVLGTGTTWYRF